MADMDWGEGIAKFLTGATTQAAQNIDTRRKEQLMLQNEVWKERVKNQLAQESAMQNLNALRSSGLMGNDGSVFVKGIDARTGMPEFGVRSPEEMQKVQDVYGLSNTMPRFARYAAHELANESPALATQRVAQLEGKLIEKYPTQANVITKRMGTLKPLMETYQELNPETNQMETRSRFLNKTGKGAQVTADNMQRVEKIRQAAQDRLDTIAEIKKGINYFGRLGKMSSQFAPSSILGGEGYDKRKTWENATNQLLAQLGFDMMKEMKEASKTGATGLGQLSEKEGEWIRQASTQLTRDLPKERALKILTKMEELHNRVLYGDKKKGSGSQGRNLDRNMALSILSEAGGDKNMARQIAAQRGYKF